MWEDITNEKCNIKGKDKLYIDVNGWTNGGMSIHGIENCYWTMKTETLWQLKL